MTQCDTVISSFHDITPSQLLVLLLITKGDLFPSALFTTTNTTAKKNDQDSLKGKDHL